MEDEQIQIPDQQQPAALPPCSFELRARRLADIQIAVEKGVYRVATRELATSLMQDMVKAAEVGSCRSAGKVTLGYSAYPGRIKAFD